MESCINSVLDLAAELQEGIYIIIFNAGDTGVAWSAVEDL